MNKFRLETLRREDGQIRISPEDFAGLVSQFSFEVGREEAEDIVNSIILQSTHVLLVKNETGCVIGFGDSKYYPKIRTLQFQSAGVDKSYRRNGILTLMVDTIISLGQKMNVRDIILETDQSTPQNRMYERKGFQPDDPTKSVLTMRLRLTR